MRFLFSAGFRSSVSALLLIASGHIAFAQAPAPTGEKATSAKRQEPTVVELPPIVVESLSGYAARAIAAGGKEAVPLLEVPNSVTVITRQRMDDQNVVTIDDALKDVPGVSVVPWDTSTSQYYSRGYALDVMYDGVPAYSSTSGLQEFDMSIYERMEVQRGPDGLTKGVSNPGGTVNLVRKRGLAAPSLSGTASLGSWSNLRGEIDVGGPLTKDGRVRGRFVTSAQDRGFFHKPTHLEKELVYGALDVDLTDRTVLSIAAAFQDNATQSPSMGLPAYQDGRFLDVPRSTHVYPRWNKYRFRTTEYSAQVRHEFENRWVFSAKANHREQDKFWKDSFPSPNTGVDPDTMTATYTRRSSDVEIDRSGVDAYISGPFELLGKEHRLTAGYSHEIYRLSSQGVTLAPNLVNVPIFDPDAFVPEPNFRYTNGSDSRTEQSGFYGQARITLADPLIVIGGGRFSNFNAKSRAIAPSPVTAWRQGASADNRFTPYAGLVYYLTPDITVYGSYADIFIPQTQMTVTGQTLDPRVGAQYEAGVKGSFFEGGLNASLALFRTRDRNRAMPDPANPMFSIQAGEAEVKGFEAELSGSPLKGLELTAGYTFLDTVYINHQTTKGQVFSLFEPEHSFKGYARYTFSSSLLKDLSLSAGFQFSSGMAGPGGFVRKQGKHVIVNAQADYRLSEHVSAGLAVNNLFNEKYHARIGGLNTYNTYGEPRNALLTVKARF